MAQAKPSVRPEVHDVGALLDGVIQAAEFPQVPVAWLVVLDRMAQGPSFARAPHDDAGHDCGRKRWSFRNLVTPTATNREMLHR
jgi:hypothetical protein